MSGSRLHSDESVERAAITLRGITQELNGRGISAVMLLEEQIVSLRAEVEALRAEQLRAHGIDAARAKEQP